MQGAIQENIEVTYHDLDNGIYMNLEDNFEVTNNDLDNGKLFFFSSFIKNFFLRLCVILIYILVSHHFIFNARSDSRQF
jgi:hypothetical protein